MKKQSVRSCGLLLAAGGWVFVSGCIVVPERHVERIGPPIIVEEPVRVPASYVIVDGEYFGWVGDRYYYLGAGGLWLICDPLRLEHFHRWERSHRDWREHAIRNDHFRRDAQGHEYPRHDDRHVQPNHSDPRVQPSRSNSHVQPGKADPRVQYGRSDSHVVQPGQADPRVQYGRSDPHGVQPGQATDPRVQPGRSAPHGIQPGSGKPPQAAPGKKVTEKDAH